MALEQTSEQSNKQKALEIAIQSIEKQFGRGSIMKLGNDSKREGIRAISTGSLSLDIALGVGGVPKGRVVEIYGPESSGKTTLSLHLVAECQKAGGTAAFIDAEHALDTQYAKALGVDIDNLLVSQPDSGEQALEIVDMLIKSAGVDIVVIDSVAALVPRAELEGDMGDAQMGAQARLMSQALRKLTGSIHRTNATVVFINQIRMKIGVMFGNPETTTGGNALKFYASVRLDVRRIASIKSGEEVIGNRTKVRVVKNKVAPPFKETEFDIIYGKGISREGDLLDMASELNVIQKSGTWYTYGDERLGQGRDNARATLEQRPEMYKEIMNKVLEMKGIRVPGQSAPEEKATAGAEKAVAEMAVKSAAAPAAPAAPAAKPAKSAKH